LALASIKLTAAEMPLLLGYLHVQQLGVSVKDKVVIVRYGGVFRGNKVFFAEERGAKGVIIYSDPADDGCAAQKMLLQGDYWCHAQS